MFRVERAAERDHADGGVNIHQGTDEHAAIHHRHFGSIEFDERIVDLKAGEGGHQMLDGRDFRAILGDRGTEGGRNDVAPVGCDINAAEIGNPSRVHFDKLHVLSERVEEVVLLMGLVTVVLVARAETARA